MFYIYVILISFIACITGPGGRSGIRLNWLPMYNISFLACTKVELWDLTVCIDVDLEPTMPNIKLVQVIFIILNIFKFLRSISF